MSPNSIYVQIQPPFVELVHADDVRRAVQAVFAEGRVEAPGELSVVITDDAEIRALNCKYRQVDDVTDVLSFSAGPSAAGFVTSPEEGAYLGDVIISYPRTIEQAGAYEHPVTEELSLLVVHGVLHLLGYDHETEGDKEEMWRLQSAALARLGIRWQP